MPAAPLDTIPARERSHARAREEAFGTLELVIALIIVAILMAAVMPKLFGARQATKAKEALAAAAAYDQAIASYKADHANQLPPANAWATISGKPAGPRNLLNRPYMGSLPDAVAGGRVLVNTACGGGSPTGSVVAVIAYCAEAAPNYRIEVRYRDADSVKTCYRGSTARTPRC